MNDLQLTFLYQANLADAPITSPIVEIKGHPHNTCCGPFLNVSINDIPAGGTAVTIKMQGSNDIDFSTSADVFTSAALDTTVGMPNFVVQISNPFPKFRYYRIEVTPTGTYTSGLISAYMSDRKSFNWQQLEGAMK